MDNTIDFTTHKEERDFRRLQQELSKLPDRDCDMRMEIWLDDKGKADLSCLSFRKEEMAPDRIANVMDAAFENLKMKRPADNDYILYIAYLTNAGKSVRTANTEICTDTTAWHARRIVKAATRDYIFMLKLAWRAWVRPIKSNP